MPTLVITLGINFLKIPRILITIKYYYSRLYILILKILSAKVFLILLITAFLASTSPIRLYTYINNHSQPRELSKIIKGL